MEQVVPRTDRLGGWIGCLNKLAKAALVCGMAGVPVLARAAGPTSPPADFFPIGVYGQQAVNFPSWKARGVNTVVAFSPPGAWQDYWNDAAVAQGLWMIRNPRMNLKADINQPYLLAWEQTDLPDVNKVPVKTLAATYAQWKAADPNRQIVVNLSAASIGAADATYAAAADWVSSEIFPVAMNRADWIDKALGTPMLNPGSGVESLRAISGGKRQFAYIETSNQAGSKGNRGPTAAEVRGETWDAIIHGARGVIYYPSAGTTPTDPTPSDVAAGITLTDAVIGKYGAALNSLSDDEANTVSLPGGLEETWRDYHGQRIYFVLNFSHGAVSQRFSLAGLSGSAAIGVPEEGRSVAERNGMITDNFGGYGVHIYTTTTGVGAGVPEPAGGAVVVGAMVFALRRRKRVGLRPDRYA